MLIEEVKIKLAESSYNVLIGNNFLKTNPFKELVENREVLLVYDKNLDPSKIKEFQTDYLSETKNVCISLEATEENKSFKSLIKIQDLLMENQFSKECILIGLGGGIVCDITGFAAATFQRGVDFILVPTTLLSQVDASVGGKTAINHPKGKNMIGSFHQPKLVCIETAYLSTLPDREIKCGLVEMIKHGLIVDKNYFSWIEERIDTIKRLDKPTIIEAIQRSIEIKSKIVSLDEKEKGIREILNFGHTFGHGLELIGKYKDYKHGEAVALGILSASKLSEMKGNLTKNDFNRIRSLFTKAGINTTTVNEINSEELYYSMQSDKKKKGKNLTFILLEEIGKATRVNNLSKLEIKEAIEKSLITY